MTKADFVKNNRGINQGKDVDLSFLEAIFDEIQKRNTFNERDAAGIIK